MRAAKQPPVLIREMMLEDLAVVFDLGSELFRAEDTPTLYRCWNEEDILKLYENHRETCLIATVNDTIAGFALGSIMDKPGNAWRYGWLDWLGVDPICSRRRIGRRLVKQLQERFIDREVRIMLVDTCESNQKALEFFRQTGFGQEIRHVYMSLNLDSHPKTIERKYSMQL